MAILTQKSRLDLVSEVISNPPKLESSPLLTKIAQRPTVDDVLSGLPILTHETVLIGICEDGVPLLLDLHNPSPGSVLVIGQKINTAVNLIEVAHRSLLLANNQHTLEIFRISDSAPATSHPIEHWINPYDRTLESTLSHLSDITNARQNGKMRGPSIVLLVDSLEWVLEADYEAKWALEYLLHYGPNQKIWPIVATTPDNESVFLRWLRRFKTLIWAADLSPDVKHQFNLPEHPFFSTLPDSHCFSLKSQGQWLHIWLPEL
ncbi:MAG: hypothetical protein N3A60_02815 [Thermanaerothrix sp.]|nr:hypothetical protein [Thermanaerothrix sp.]